MASEKEEPFLHALILVEKDKGRAIDLILEYHNGNGLEGSQGYTSLLKRHVQQLCTHKRLDYGLVMHHARQRSLDIVFPSELASSNILGDTSLSEASRSPPPTRYAQPASFSYATPPRSQFGGSSESRTTPETINIPDQLSEIPGGYLPLPVGYSRLGLNLIKRTAAGLIHGYQRANIEPPRQIFDPDAVGKDQILQARECIMLRWYLQRPNDYATKGPHPFYIVDNLHSGSVLLSESLVAQEYDRSDSPLGARPFSPRWQYQGGLNFYDATATHPSHNGGTPPHMRSGYSMPPDAMRNLPPRFDGLFQPEAQPGKMSQHTLGLEASTNAQWLGRPPPAVPDPPTQQQPQQGQSEPLPAVVKVAWFSGDGSATTNAKLDLTQMAPEEFEATLVEILDDFDMEPHPHLYRLRFDNGKLKRNVRLKNGAAEMWPEIVAWMPEYAAGGPIHCKVENVARP